jgi:hypothetical protein
MIITRHCSRNKRSGRLLLKDFYACWLTSEIRRDSMLLFAVDNGVFDPSPAPPMDLPITRTAL